MQTLFWACAFFFLRCCSAQGCEYITDKAEYFLEYTEAKELCLRVDNGFQIMFEVNLIETDPTSGDYLIIKQGENLEDDGAGIIFAHNLETPKTFVIYSTVAFVKFEVNPTSTSKLASFSYRRIGEEIITSTENPLPQSTWPQPSGNDSIYYTVHVAGYEYSRYKEKQVQLKFRKSVAKMAIEYSETNNFPVIKAITAANVLLTGLKMCPLELPESSTCAMITFALPVFLNETQNSGYEFKEQHLSAMWVRYGNKYLAENKFSIYEVPNVDAAAIAWGTVIAIVMVVFLLLLGAAICIHGKIMYYVKLNRRASDGVIIIDQDQRESAASLSPHRLQVFPPIFGQDVIEDVWTRENKTTNTNKTKYNNTAFETSDVFEDVWNRENKATNKNKTNNIAFETDT